jgi:hypothetical protein
MSSRVILNVICALLVAAFAYGLYHAGREKAQLEAQLQQYQDRNMQLLAVIEQKEENLRQINTANAQNAIRFAQDQLALERLDELAHETPQNADRCLDADAARRVRDIR